MKVIAPWPLTDEQYAALTASREAGGEPLDGIVAVLQVIRNRVLSPRFPNTWTEVCLQPKQFSCWNKTDPNRKILDAMASALAGSSNGALPPKALDVLGAWTRSYRECLHLTQGVMSNIFRDFVKGATHYHTRDVQPKWSRGKTPCAKIGRHLFFNTIK